MKGTATAWQNETIVGKGTAIIRISRQVLHDDFLAAFAVERRSAGNHLEQHDAKRVNIDFFAVNALANLRRHVVERSDALRLSAAAAGRNKLRQSVVADLYVAVFVEDISRLEILMHDAMIVQ